MMDWYPLRLSTPIAQHVFGARRIPDDLGRTGLPEGRIAETWECSDVEGKIAVVRDGPLAGRTLRELTLEHPAELVGATWSGQRFPILTKFIDGSGMLPVHLHGDDEAARRFENEPNGKTEAWHILWAAPGATALVGTKPGVTQDTLRQALLHQDYDSTMRRLPVRSGETIYVPGGTLHSFGPDTLIYEVEQTSDIQQHAMPWNMQDGTPVPDDRQRANIENLLQQWRPDPRPDFTPALRLSAGDGIDRAICCAGPYFALERWRVQGSKTLAYSQDKAVILSNVGARITIAAGHWAGELGPAESLLLPAALPELYVQGPADILLSYLPDLRQDIRAPLQTAGYGASVTAALGAPDGKQ